MSSLELPLDRAGLQRGKLSIPWSTDRSAYGQVEVPVFALVGPMPGPTVLLVGGVHGDEYEGPLVLADLVRHLDPAALLGRVLIVPRANPLACRAGRRTTPDDGGNLARSFPGNPAGPITSALAAAFTSHVLPLADAVVDLHAGGSSLEYLPCAWGRLPRERKLAARVLDLLLAFGGDVAAITPAPERGATLVAAALALGIPAIAAELGGAGTLLPHSLAVARQGCRNVLTHLGLQEGQPGPPAPLLAVRPQHFLRSPGFGVFEPAVILGQTVAAGAVAGWLHDPERPEHAPEPLRFGAPGQVICRRVPARAEPGDVLAHLGEPATVEALYEEAMRHTA